MGADAFLLPLWAVLFSPVLLSEGEEKVVEELLGGVTGDHLSLGLVLLSSSHFSTVAAL